MPSIQRTKSDYSFLKQRILKRPLGTEVDLTLIEIELLCSIAYSFNFVLADQEIEDYMSALSRHLFSLDRIEARSNDNDHERYVFYDSFALDNRGLTQQYIRALHSWGIPFLFILESDLTIGRSTKILKELEGMANAEVYIAPSSLNKIQRAQKILEKVKDYAPSKVFLHLTPESTVANLVWNTYTMATRYQINLTDHAFWLGKNISDFVIDFRSYGSNLNNQLRGIPLKKCLIQPFYPIQSKATFKGFPVDTSGKTILFTGGSFYKMYGDNYAFFKILKTILVSNPEVILFIAGGGISKPIDDFISDNLFSDRIILLGNRTDINEVFSKIDIYLSTYPLTGGLMGQFAALNKKSLIGFTSDDLKVNFFEELINTSSRLVFTNLEEFHTEINKLISSIDYRNNKALNLNNSIITEDIFSQELKKLIELNQSNYFPNSYPISIEKSVAIYSEAENKYIKMYGYLFYSAYIKKKKLPPLRFYTHILKFMMRKLSS